MVLGKFSYALYLLFPSFLKRSVPFHVYECFMNILFMLCEMGT